MKCFRSPRTMQERKEAAFSAVSDEPRMRAKFRPTDYDDIPASSQKDRSWKKSRKTKWRE